MFQIYDVSDSVTDRPETIGSKEKFWLIPAAHLSLPNKMHLFKVGRPNTGENWAEKACCEIAKALEIPCAEYNLAICKGIQGVLSERFVPDGAPFYPANLIFSRMDPEYDGALRFKQVRYQLLSALGILRSRNLRSPVSMAAFPRMQAHGFFIGYLVFDALIGNTDRHHENWGIVVLRDAPDTISFQLAPTFDHASSLGRELSDARRREVLGSRDQRSSVEAYANRARSAFFGARPAGRTMTSREVLENLVQAFPDPTKLWAAKISEMERSVVESIFSNIPREVMSPEAGDFALELVAYNQRMIREVVLGR
jgi:HipA-like C-terminal domain